MKKVFDKYYGEIENMNALYFDLLLYPKTRINF